MLPSFLAAALMEMTTSDNHKAGSHQATTVHVRDGKAQQADRMLADEEAVALSYGGTTHAVMMATPQDLIDFATGFSLTEGLITNANEIEAITLQPLDLGIDVQIDLNTNQRAAFQARRRHMAGPVGCGLCGIESIEAAMRSLPRLDSDLRVAVSDIGRAVAALSQGQKLNQVTRCAHAAGFYVVGRGLVALREDIGRHNALDKLIGALLRKGEDISQGMIVVTSRLSVEMVQKTALAGAPILIAISAPTARAVSDGTSANMTLIARARGDDFEIYTHPQRIIFS